jgi:hypothetical protein
VFSPGEAQSVVKSEIVKTGAVEIEKRRAW